MDFLTWEKHQNYACDTSTYGKNIIFFTFYFGVFVFTGIIAWAIYSVEIEADIDWNNPPCSPDELSSNWKEITHPKMQKFNSRREFVYQHTNLIIAFEKGQSNALGFKGKDHWHRFNPNKTNRHDTYQTRKAYG